MEQTDEQQLSALCEAVRRKWLTQTGDRMLAEDIAQETALIALERFDGIEQAAPEQLAAFFYRTARFLHLGHVRRSTRVGLQPPEAIDQLPNGNRNPEAELERTESRSRLRAALASLAQPRDRDMLTRLLLCEQQKAEVCVALSLSASHFDRVRHRAKERARAAVLETAATRAETAL